MKIVLLTVGKTDPGGWKEALETYRKRLAHYIPFEVEELPDLKQAGQLTPELQKRREGEQILKSLQTTDSVVLLDEKGAAYTSMQFAAYLEKKMHTVPRRLVFVVGGPYGYDEAVYSTVKERLSLSRMTFSHQMIRAILAEQLYRAMTILRNEPYHHE